MLGRIAARCGFPLRQAARQWLDDDGHLLSATVAYYVAVSFFPVLLIVTSGLGFFLKFSGWGQDAQTGLLDIIRDQTSEALADQVAMVLSEVEARAAIGGPVGFAVLIVAALAVFAHFESAFDRIWKTAPPDSRGPIGWLWRVIFHRLKAFAMLLGLGFLVIALFVGSMVLAAMNAWADRMAPSLGPAWERLHPIIIVTANWLLFALFYKTLPRARVRWIDALRGGAVAAAIWAVGRQGLAILLIGERYTAYGVIGSFIVILLWAYYAGAVVFFGAEVVQALAPPGAGEQIPRAKSVPMQDLSIDQHADRND